MDDVPEVSIVTTTHDNATERGGTLQVLRAGLQRQRVPPGSEWIVVDDGTTDETAAFLDAVDGETVGDLRVTVVREPHTGNRAAGRNRGVEAAASDLLLFIDADTVPLGDRCVERAVRARREGSFACGARRYWSPREWSTEAVVRRVRTRPETVRDWAHLPLHSMRRRDGRRALQEFSLVANFGIVPRADVRAVGGFDESFAAWGYEAEDLMFRLLDRGLDVTNLFASVAVLHLNHPLDVPSGAAATNRDRYRSKLAARGVTFDLPGLLTRPAGEYDDLLRPREDAGRGRSGRTVAVARPDRLGPIERGERDGECYAVRRRGSEPTRYPRSDAESDERTVSVVISTADCFSDRGGSIELVLRALENQRADDFEVVVVDDGSTDETGAFLREFAAESTLDLTLVSFDRNSGNRSKARNRGAERAEGDLLLFVDDDTVPLSSDAVGTLRELYSPGTFLCGARRHWTETDWDRPTFEAKVVDEEYDWLRAAGVVPKGVSRRRGSRSLWEVTHLTNFGLVSKRDFLDVGGFDAETFAQWGREDIDLMLRLYLNGVGFLNLFDHVSVLHLNHPLKAGDRASREEAFYEYKRKEREEYGFEFDLNRLYGVAADEGPVLVPVED
jgi:glycosyltransferase involved in cell wall biosynthesis